MKTIKSLLIILFSYCVLSISVYAKDTDWTDVAVCESMVSRFDKNAFSTLFNRAPNLAFKSSKVCNSNLCNRECYIDIICETGCDISSKFQPQGTREMLGSVLVYRQNNSVVIFTENKNKFGIKSKVKFTNDQNSPLKSLFPWALEGYYEFQNGAASQQFSAYTKSGDYIIFILNYGHIKPYKQPSPNQMDERFIKFIQTTARQMGY